MIVVLAGGVGAARFIEGLVQVVPPRTITAVVNTGDDITLHGLHVSPDLDIVTCTLANLIDREQGWGIVGDTAECMSWLVKLGAPGWFKLGDRDLALHIRRTAMLNEGFTLSEVADSFRRSLGVAVHILPMSDDPVPTCVLTDAGEVHFEEYFVKNRARNEVRGVRYAGAEQAKPAPGVLDLIAQAETIVIAPSNPVVSIGPILSLPGVRDAITASHAPVVTMSPIVGGAPVKGPAAPLMRAVGLDVSAVGAAQAYAGLLNGIVIDTVDAGLAPRIEALGVQVAITDTIMRGPAEKANLARVALELAGRVTSSE